ncbi:MAG TPA: hypothetical protein VNN07_14020, partial [Candidatus Tectomicrobia bacterium]|nr:hypothetical protein [Candidatus Tectomicrobia bacterium]
MRLFAGVAARDPERRTDRQALVAMAARVRAADPHVLVRDRIGLLVAGVEHPGTAQPGMTIGGDVDVTNAGEVCEIGGADQVLDALGALYRREGAAALRRLRGAFALAIWDEARAELVLAVDQLGIGRLYVAERPDAILFATRVGALVGPGGVAGEADPA